MKFVILLLCVTVASSRNIRNENVDDRSRESDCELLDGGEHKYDHRSDGDRHRRHSERDEKIDRPNDRRDDESDQSDHRRAQHNDSDDKDKQESDPTDRGKDFGEVVRSAEIPPMSPLAYEMEKINRAEEESMEREDSRERRLLDNVAHPLEYGDDESSRSRERSRPRDRQLSAEDGARNDYDHEDSAHPYENPNNRNRIPPLSGSDYDVHDDPPRKDSSASREDSRERNIGGQDVDAPNRNVKIRGRHNSAIGRTEDDSAQREDRRDDNVRSEPKETSDANRHDEYEAQTRGYPKKSRGDDEVTPEEQHTAITSGEQYSRPPARVEGRRHPQEAPRRPPSQSSDYVDRQRSSVSEDRRPRTNSGYGDVHEGPNVRHKRKYSSQAPRKTFPSVANRRNPRAVIPVYESFLPHQKTPWLDLGQARPLPRERSHLNEERQNRRPSPAKSRDEASGESDREPSGEHNDVEDTGESHASRERDRNSPENANNNHQHHQAPAPPRRPAPQEKLQPASKRKGTIRRPASSRSSRLSGVTLQPPRAPTSTRPRPQLKALENSTPASSSTTARPAVRPWRWQGNVNIADDDFFRIPEKFREFGAKLGTGTSSKFSPTARSTEGQSRKGSSSSLAAKLPSDAAAEASRFHDSFRAYDVFKHAMYSPVEHAPLSSPGQTFRSTTETPETRQTRKPTSNLVVEGGARNSANMTREAFWKTGKPTSGITAEMPQLTTSTSQAPSFWKTLQTPNRVTTKQAADGLHKTTIRGTASVGWFKLDDEAARPDLLKTETQRPATTSKPLRTSSQSANLPPFVHWMSPAENVNTLTRIQKYQDNHDTNNKKFEKAKRQQNQERVPTVVPDLDATGKFHEKNGNLSRASTRPKDPVVYSPQEFSANSTHKNSTAKEIPVLESTPILQKKSDDLHAAASQQHEEGTPAPQELKKHEEFEKNYDKTKQSILNDFGDMNKENHFMPSEYVISVKYKNSTNKEAERRLKSRGFTETHHRLVERFEIIHQHENSEERVGTEEPQDPDQAAIEETKDSRVKAMSEDNLRQMRDGGDISRNQVIRPPIEVRTLLHGYRGTKPYEIVYRGNHPENVHKIPSEGFPIDGRFKNWVHRGIDV